MYSPTEARRIASRFDVHYTPKHGSWLNMEETLWQCTSHTARTKLADTVGCIAPPAQVWYQAL